MKWRAVKYERDDGGSVSLSQVEFEFDPGERWFALPPWSLVELGAEGRSFKSKAYAKRWLDKNYPPGRPRK